MGICCRAKGIICSNNICDVPVYINENKPNNSQINNDYTNNNSINNDFNNTINKNINFSNNNNLKNSHNNNINNNLNSNETALKNIEQNKEGKAKSILIKNENKIFDKKQSTDEDKDEKKNQA